jgi:hypothetical protein
MTDEPRRYWFPAKRWGWGWGPPSSAAGWIFLVAWIGVILALGPILAARSLPLFAIFTVSMVVILLAVCWIKGEPPKWRWPSR